MTRGLYKAEVGGASMRVSSASFRTISECREFAEFFGSTADWCTIYDWKGRTVGEHRREGHKAEWYRVPWQSGWHVP